MIEWQAEYEDGKVPMDSEGFAAIKVRHDKHCKNIKNRSNNIMNNIILNNIIKKNITLQ